MHTHHTPKINSTHQQAQVVISAWPRFAFMHVFKCVGKTCGVAGTRGRSHPAQQWWACMHRFMHAMPWMPWHACGTWCVIMQPLKWTFELDGAAGSEGTCKRTRARRVGSVVSGIRMDRRRGAHEACDGSHSYDKRGPHRWENESQRGPVEMLIKSCH
jgi:hypothetical protein